MLVGVCAHAAASPGSCSRAGKTDCPEFSEKGREEKALDGNCFPRESCVMETEALLTNSLL